MPHQHLHRAGRARRQPAAVRADERGHRCNGAQAGGGSEGVCAGGTEGGVPVHGMCGSVVPLILCVGFAPNFLLIFAVGEVGQEAFRQIDCPDRYSGQIVTLVALYFVTTPAPHAILQQISKRALEMTYEPTCLLIKDANVGGKSYETKVIKPRHSRSK